jgi:FkbM family methyltransferase
MDPTIPPPEFLTLEEFKARPLDEDYPFRNWGGWTTLARGIEVNIANTFAPYDDKAVHEGDFLFFANFGSRPTLFVDVGANMGFSAISFSNVNPQGRIVSFEINPLLGAVLGEVKARIPNDFEFHMVGAGEKAADLTLYVPVVGSLMSTPLASLSPPLDWVRKIRTDYIRSGRGVVDLLTLPVRVLPLDEFRLTPDFVKIDVEGHELSALKGLGGTLSRCDPVLMIEKSDDAQTIPWLRERGYFRYAYSSEQNCLRRTDELHSGLNAFYLTARGRDFVERNGVRVIGV